MTTQFCHFCWQTLRFLLAVDTPVFRCPLCGVRRVNRPIGTVVSAQAH